MSGRGSLGFPAELNAGPGSGKGSFAEGLHLRVEGPGLPVPLAFPRKGVSWPGRLVGACPEGLPWERGEPDPVRGSRVGMASLDLALECGCLLFYFSERREGRSQTPFPGAPPRSRLGFLQGRQASVSGEKLPESLGLRKPRRAVAHPVAIPRREGCPSGPPGRPARRPPGKDGVCPRPPRPGRRPCTAWARRREASGAGVGP